MYTCHNLWCPSFGRSTWFSCTGNVLFVRICLSSCCWICVFEWRWKRLNVISGKWNGKLSANGYWLRIYWFLEHSQQNSSSEKYYVWKQTFSRWVGQILWHYGFWTTCKCQTSNKLHETSDWLSYNRVTIQTFSGFYTTDALCYGTYKSLHIGTSSIFVSHADWKWIPTQHSSCVWNTSAALLIQTVESCVPS